MKPEEYIRKEHQTNKVELTGKREMATGVWLISWKRDRPFIPGQVVKLAIASNHPPRIYSLCSGPDDDNFSVLFDVKDDGLLTPRLAALSVGDSFLASAPYGSFACDGGPSIFIATGTGIAPFRSMLLGGEAQNAMVVHGAKTPEQCYFDHEFEAMPEGHYFRCISRGKDTGHFEGRVTDWLKIQNNLPLDFKYYLCRRALMVVEVRDILIGKGIPYQNIKAEIYF